MKNFNDINLKLCHYCGTCVGVCPEGVISINDGLPNLSGKCIDCGLCYKACPGIEFSYPEFRQYLFSGLKDDSVIGNYHSIYFGYSSDAALRNKASAGGVITAILVGMLKSGQIDAAVVVGMNKAKPWEVDVRLAKTAADIYGASQSKYSMVSLNSILRKIGDIDSDSIALVGLPCHIHGIRKLQKLKSESVKKIKYCIGIFCGMNLDKESTNYLIRKLKVNKSDISSLEYRGGGWPGGFTIKTTKDARKYFLKKDIYNYLQLMFAPKRCLLCPDLMNEFADISVGDAWDKALGKEGWSTVITRTKIGDELVNKAIINSAIKVRQADISQIYQGHAHLVTHKKKGFNVRKGYFPEIPKFDLPDNSLMSRKESIFNHFSIFLFRFMRNPIISNCLKCMPLYFFVFISSSFRLAAMNIFKPKKQGIKRVF